MRNLLFSSFLCTSYFATSPLSFIELDKPSAETWAGKEIIILGFLTCNEQQEWFLAKQPNIKTCCLGKKQNSIRLLADFSPKLINQVIHVQGTLKIEKEVEGTRYILENPNVISNRG